MAMSTQLHLEDGESQTGETSYGEVIWAIVDPGNLTVPDAFALRIYPENKNDEVICGLIIGKNITSRMRALKAFTEVVDERTRQQIMTCSYIAVDDRREQVIRPTKDGSFVIDEFIKTGNNQF